MGCSWLLLLLSLLLWLLSLLLGLTLQSCSRRIFLQDLLSSFIFLVNFENGLSDVFLHCLLVNFLNIVPRGPEDFTRERCGLNYNSRFRLLVPRLHGLHDGLCEVIDVVVVGLVPLLGEEVNSLKQTLASVSGLVREAELPLQVVDVLLHLLEELHAIRLGLRLQTLNNFSRVPVFALGLLALGEGRGSLVGEERRERTSGQRRTGGSRRGIVVLLLSDLRSVLLQTEDWLQWSDGSSSSSCRSEGGQGQLRA